MKAMYYLRMMILPRVIYFNNIKDILQNDGYL